MMYIEEWKRWRIRGRQEGWLARYAAPPLKKKRPLRKLGRKRRDMMIARAAGILKFGEPTLFAFEAFLRRDLRAKLCLEGWRWQDADDAVLDVIDIALKILGAKRPPWKEGQPEWAQEGFPPIDRTRCINCGHRLPEEHKFYCSRICTDRYRHRRRHAWESAYDYAARFETRWTLSDSGRSV